MKYFRTYPWGLQLLLFFLMGFTLLSAAQYVIPIILYKSSGLLPAQLENVTPSSPVAVINAALVVDGLGNVMFFLVPGLLFAYLTTPRPAEYLGLRAPGKKIQWLLVALMMLGAIPVLSVLESLLSLINFGPGVKAMQAASDSTFGAFLDVHSFGGFMKVFVLLAIAPAIGEELFFRGVFMRFVKKRSKTMTVPIVFTALIFALMHFNVYGLPSIFLAGILLAVIYNLTGSLLCSMLAHLVFNGTQIILSYYGNNNAAVKSFLASNNVPYYLVVSGAVVFTISFYLLLKNKTPLPANWTDDFTKDELPEKSEWDFMSKN